MTPAPLGMDAAVAAGLGVRAGSVTNHRPGSDFAQRAGYLWRARRLSPAAILTSDLFRVLQFKMTEPVPSARLSSARLNEIQTRMASAARAAGRDPAALRLVAVSKQQPWESIEPILAAGQTAFGENRVQEAKERWGDRREGLTLHLIGPLQTNKAGEAVAVFDVIETLDRLKLARVLETEIQKAGRAPRLYVQVNTGEEPQKAGVIPTETDGFIAECRGLGLQIEGLMCIPPVDEEPAMHFALLAKIAARNGLAKLSMGMSDDFETAIRFGATSVRVGSALFGARLVKA